MLIRLNCNEFSNWRCSLSARFVIRISNCEVVRDDLGTLDSLYAGCEWQILLDGVRIAFFSAGDLTGTITVHKRMNNTAHMA